MSPTVTNNSININQVNNHLSLQLIEHKHTTFSNGNPVAGFRHVHKCGGVKTPNEIPLFPLSSISRFYNWLPVTVGKEVSICICFIIAVPPLRVDTTIQQSNETLSIYIHVERVYPYPQCSVVIGVSKTKQHWYRNFISTQNINSLCKGQS